MEAPKLRPGDRVVYTKEKFGARPGPRARNVSPAPRGDIYSYAVEKLWVVDRRIDQWHIELRTRRGKRHVVDERDHHLRLATWWDRLRHFGRFPEAD